MIVCTSQVRETSVSSTEPVSVAEAKTHLRVDISDDDTLIGALVTAAREFCEQYCGRSFVEHTYRADLANFYDEIVLPMGPVQSVSSIKYYDTASPSVQQTLSSAVYSLNYDTVRRNHGQSWLSVYPRSDSVQITYVTGWKDSSSPQGVGGPVPEAVKAAIKLLVGEMYENREASIIGLSRTDNPTMYRLLNPYRVYL